MQRWAEFLCEISEGLIILDQEGYEGERPSEQLWWSQTGLTERRCRKSRGHLIRSVQFANPDVSRASRSKRN